MVQGVLYEKSRVRSKAGSPGRHCGFLGEFSWMWSYMVDWEIRPVGGSPSDVAVGSNDIFYKREKEHFVASRVGG